MVGDGLRMVVGECVVEHDLTTSRTHYVKLWEVVGSHWKSLKFLASILLPEVLTHLTMKDLIRQSTSQLPSLGRNGIGEVA